MEYQELKDQLELLQAENNSLKTQVQEAVKEKEYWQGKCQNYESDGTSNMYHSLVRKQNEMAQLLNKHNLTELTIDDPKDKSFERLKAIWSDASTLAESVKALKAVLNPDGEEKKEQPKPHIANTLADKRDN